MLSTFKFLKNSKTCVVSRSINASQSKLNVRNVKTKENPESIKVQELTDEELKRELKV